eukprot:SM000106S13972  [mRNA]  locus=s106:464238:466947:+ [translate_table: standard]
MADVPWVCALTASLRSYLLTKLAVRGKEPRFRHAAWERRHEWGGARIYRLVLEMSGFYVKSAQILASKSDIMPDAWTRRLAKLFDSAPPRPFAEVESSLREQLAMVPAAVAAVSDAFAFLDAHPLASASIAQAPSCPSARPLLLRHPRTIPEVHAARLLDGRHVVVKVQHLGMDAIMASDLRNIGRVAKLVKPHLPFDLEPIVREIQRTIPLEFDFTREVWFMQKIKQSLRQAGFDSIVCPAPVLPLCAPRMIVMERLDGVPFTQILDPHSSAEIRSRHDTLFQTSVCVRRQCCSSVTLDWTGCSLSLIRQQLCLPAARLRAPAAEAVLERLVEAYGHMLLIDGVFHADPHPGNLFLLDNGRLGLLDFGQSKILDNDTRQQLARVVLAIDNGRDEEIAAALAGAGMGFGRPSEAYGSAAAANGSSVDVHTLATMATILFDTRFVPEGLVSPMSEDSPLHAAPLTMFNQALWLVVRVMVLLRGICHTLRMDLQSSALWRPYALAALSAPSTGAHPPMAATEGDGD